MSIHSASVTSRSSPMSTNVARVALLRRFPRAARPFDYVIPEDLTVTVGSFVVVPLRGRKTTGVVVSLSDATAIAHLMPIECALDIPPLSERDIRFYDALRRRTYQSWHSILHAAIPDVPKRKRNVDTPLKEPTPFSIPEEDVLTVQTIVRHIHEISVASVVIPSDRIGIACVVASVLRDPRPHLILVGERHTADLLVALIPDAVLYAGAMSKNTAHERWLDIRLGRRTVVATRIGALVPPSSNTRVIVLGSGSDDLLQGDQNPHYDARWCVLQRSATHQNPLALLDVLPRVEDEPLTLDAWRVPSCELIDMHEARPQSGDWFLSDRLRTAIETADLSRGPFVVYCNRVWKENGAQTTNRDVADRLRAWRREATVTVVEAEDALPQTGIVIVTRTFLYRLPYLLPRACGVAIVRAEQELTYRGFRSLEQAARLLRRLVSWAGTAHAPCFVQADEPETIRAALGDTAVWHSSELASRRRVGYPPIQDLHVLKTTEDIELIASFRAQHPDALGSATSLVLKRSEGEVIEEWLTYPPSCDIFVSPDSIDP